MSKPFFDTIKVTLLPGQFRKFDFFGRYFTILENDTSIDAYVRIGDGGPNGYLSKGIGIPLAQNNDYTYFTVQNTDAVVTMNLTIMTSDFAIDDNRLILAPTSVFSLMLAELVLQTPDIDTLRADTALIKADIATIKGEVQGRTAAGTTGAEITVGAAAQQIFAAGAATVLRSVSSKSTNTDPIYFGFANTVTSAIWWFELLPGEERELVIGNVPYCGPVFAISTAAGQLVGWGQI